MGSSKEVANARMVASDAQQGEASRPTIRAQDWEALAIRLGWLSLRCDLTVTPISGSGAVTHNLVSPLGPLYDGFDSRSKAGARIEARTINN